MNKTKKLLIAVSLLVGLLLIVPFLIPMQTYLHQAEKMASEKLGVPVVIHSAHLFLLPSPRLAASDIVIGDNQALKVEKLTVIPTLGTLFSDSKTLDISISKPVMKQSAMALFATLADKKTTVSAPTPVHVRHIEIDDLRFAEYPALNAEATLTGENALESADIETLDGKLKGNIKPNGDEQLITLNAQHWTLPASMPLLIDSAKLEMHLKGSKLSIPSINIALYSGKVSGNAVVNWQKNWKLNGNLRIDNVAVQQPSKMASKTVYLSGNLFGNGGFSSAAKTAGQLTNNLQTNFQFNVNNGVLHGLDLAKVASLLLKQNQGGGETQFDALSGLLNSSGKEYRLSQLKISSGLLAAKGQVKIKSNKALDGAIQVDVKNGMGLAAIPLDISGTTAHPVVLPNKAALAGAIAGTAVLGPAGTGLGMKAGGALDKLKGLFSSKK